VLRASSVEFVYHFYRQDVPAPFLQSAKIPDPTGRSSTIGHEWDLVLGLDEWTPLEVELIGATFLAGRAYGPNSRSLAEGVRGARRGVAAWDSGNDPMCPQGLSGPWVRRITWLRGREPSEQDYRVVTR